LAKSNNNIEQNSINNPINLSNTPELDLYHSTDIYDGRNFLAEFQIANTVFDKPDCLIAFQNFIEKYKRYKSNILHGSDLYFTDFLTLRPGCWVTGSVLYKFFLILNNFEKTTTKHYKTKNYFVYQDLIYSVDFEKGNELDDFVFERQYLKGKTLFKGVNILMFENFIFPVFKKPNHYVMVVVRLFNTNGATVTYYDSLPVSKNDDYWESVTSFIRKFINRMEKDNGWAETKLHCQLYKDSPKQSNCTDCAIFVCMNSLDIHQYGEITTSNQNKAAFFRLYLAFLFIDFDKQQNCVRIEDEIGYEAKDHFKQIITNMAVTNVVNENNIDINDLLSNVLETSAEKQLFEDDPDVKLQKAVNNYLYAEEVAKTIVDHASCTLQQNLLEYFVTKFDENIEDVGFLKHFENLFDHTVKEIDSILDSQKKVFGRWYNGY